MQQNRPTPPVLGFLTVLRDSQDHLIGGYLLLNDSGRPLEFHCTAPVRPNRAQTILYGPTLRPYLYGEQIGRTLIEKAGTTASVVLTDSPAAMSLRRHIDLPVALVCGNAESTHDSLNDGTGELSLRTIVVGQAALAIDAQHGEDLEKIEKTLTNLASPLDLLEPFNRIREAIGEARRDANGRSATAASRRAA